MRGKHTVSFIIPTYNQGKTILGTLDSIFANNYPKENIDVIICDSYSTDNTIDICEEFSKHRYPITIIKDFPGNKSEARNACIKKSRGSLIFNFNGHAYADKKLIEVVAKKFSDADIVGVSNKNPITSPWHTLLEASLKGFMAGAESGFSQYKETDKDIYVKHAPFCCYHRSVFDRIGFFDPELPSGQDAEYNMRASLLGLRILFTGDTYVELHRADNSTSLIRQMIRYGRARRHIINMYPSEHSFLYLVPELMVISTPVLLLCIIAGIIQLEVLLVILLSYAVLSWISNPMPLSVLIYMMIHFGYGYGLLRGRFDE